MPVTGRFSKLFYERLGEQIAQEMVDWFNAVDATYRADLRELNELNFARFDAKLEQRAAELEAKIAQTATQVEAKIAQTATQLEAKIAQTAALLEAKIDRRIAELRAELMSRMDQLETRIERRLGEQTKWLLAAWGVLLASVIGLWFRR